MRNNKETTSYQTVNTFTRTPSPAQICSYVVVSLQTIVFYLIVRPYIKSQTSSIVLTVLFTVSLVIVVISSLICSYIDPSDSIMIECKKGNRHKLKTNLNELLYCDYCQAYVTPEARHCKQCDRCVQRFDHHCMWINNCVGSKNYQIFIVMIVSTCIHLSIYIAAVAVLSYERKWFTFLGFIITAWVVLLIVCILWVLLFNLNLLHFYLISKGYTTYQFIMVRRDEERQREFQRLQQQAKKKQQKMKSIIEQSKKKVFEQNPNAEDNEGNSEENMNSNKKLTKNSKENNLQEQDTNSKINMENIDRSKKRSGQRQSNIYQQAIKKSKNKDIMQQQIYDNIHMGYQSRENSQIESIKIGAIHTEQSKERNAFGYKNKQEEQEEARKSQETQSIRISQFFTRNKSFNFIISEEEAQKPHKRAANLSMQVKDQNLERKQSQTQVSKKYKSKSQNTRKKQPHEKVIPRLNSQQSKK